MHLRKPVVIGIMLVSIAVAGFAAGSFAGAYVLGDPGSEMDPLVAESYLKEAVAEATGELKEEIESLQVEIEILRNKLDLLESKASSGSSVASRTGTGYSGSQTTTSGAGNEKDTGSGIAPQPGKTGVINTPAGANLRTGPSTDYERVTTVPHQVRVELVGARQDWYEVELADGTKGWIYGELIDRD